MSRYENTDLKFNTIRRGSSKTLFEGESRATTYYSAIPKTDADLYVITQPGDRLDLLAAQFYGNVNLWWYIAKANQLTFMTVPVGSRLRIPATVKYAIGR